MGILSFLKRKPSLTELDAMAKLATKLDAQGMAYIDRISRIAIHKFTDYNSYLDAGSARIWATFRSCHLVACVIVSTEMKVLNTRGEAVENAPVNVLLRQPNPCDTWEEVIYQWTFHMKLCGNAYWVRDQMNAKGQPLALYPLLPQYVEVIPDINRRIAGYRYRVNGHAIDFTPEEIVHFRRPHPKDMIMGMGDVEPSEDLLNSQINRQIYDEQFMESGARPTGILIRKDPEEDQEKWNMFRSWWKANHVGSKNAGKTALLTGDWSYEQLGLDQAQLQSIEREKLNIEQIFMAHGVPLSIAGVREAANYATSKQDDINFRRFECMPLIDILVGKLSGQSTLTGPGVVRAFNDCTLDYELAGLINVEQVGMDWAKALEHGAITPNEFRRLCGLAVVEDNPYLDQYFVGNNRVPIEMAGLTNAADVQPPAPKKPAPTK